MSQIISSRHPYWTVREMVLDNPLIFELNFSYYLYRPQSLVDERRIFSVNRGEFLNVNLFEEIIAKTPFGFEMAFHSTVRTINGEIMHIPMIDMATPSRAQLEKLRIYIGFENFNNFFWFRSGRSFHGYGLYLISVNEWAPFLGHLLLANQKGINATVDPRWIGHRLISGYSALRWTKNTDNYLEIPSLLF